jgi:hypothetical protein
MMERGGTQVRTGSGQELEQARQERQAAAAKAADRLHAAVAALDNAIARLRLDHAHGRPPAWKLWLWQPIYAVERDRRAAMELVGVWAPTLAAGGCSAPAPASTSS